MINNGEKSVTLVGEVIDDPIIELSKSEYDAMKKQNFIANALMQWLYVNSELSPHKEELSFTTYYLSEILSCIDRDNYLEVLAQKKKEEEVKDAEQQTRSEE